MSYRYQKLGLTMFDPTAKDLPKWHTPPQEIFRTHRINNVLYCGGVGNTTNPEIMFIAPMLYEEEAAQGFVTKLGNEIKDEASFLKGSSGGILKEVCSQAGIRMEDCCYTAVIKYLVPKGTKLKKGHFDWGMPALMSEIRRMRPKLIVCLGKQVFDIFSKIKVSLSEIEGGFFDWQDPEDESYAPILFPTDAPYKLVTNPDVVERFFHNFREVAFMRDQMRGTAPARLPVNMRTIDTLPQLRALVDEIISANPKHISFDCEWGGRNHLDGKLRSTQLAWTATDGAYIRIRSAAPSHYEAMPYTFKGTEKQIGAELQRMLNAFPGRILSGHQASADMPWWNHVLGVDTYQRVIFDTLYAQQCADESLDGKLERLALMYGGMPRYDIPLQIWKKLNKLPKDAGYAAIPDDLIIPYGIFDVIATWRSVEPIKRRILSQGMRLWAYWQNECLPFVTDIFTNFTVTGLNMDRPAMDETRDFLVWARDCMEREFLTAIVKESHELLDAFVSEASGLDCGQVARVLTNAKELLRLGQPDQGWLLLKEKMPEDSIGRLDVLWSHFKVAPNFNLRSRDHMVRWLFEVKGFQPLKTTGKPAIDWIKVMTWPIEKQRTVTPSSDKAVLQVYASKDKLVAQLLELNLTGNLVKAFLKPADVDPETGDPVKENGLHAWVCSDGCIHGMFSLTETARPRSWNPNSLNWPSYVNKRILTAVMKMCARYYEDDKSAVGRDIPGFNAKLPSRFHRYVKEEPRSVRSMVVAHAGNVFVETDFKTAEIWALAFKSGDENLIRILTEDDKQFRMARDTDKDGNIIKVPIRVWYDPDYDIKPENQYPELLGHFVGEPVAITKFCKELEGDLPDFEDGDSIHAWVTARAVAHKAKTGKNLLYAGRNGADFAVVETWPVPEDAWDNHADGTPKRPSHDLHWALAESVYGRPRELMVKKLARDGTGKVGNFSSAYGATPSSLERKIKVDTGEAPPEGTGQGILDALQRKYPVSQEWLLEQEKMPDVGMTQANSGRIRHFNAGMRDYISDREYDDIVSPLKREARNFHMQHMVASIAARAAIKLVEHFRVKGMKAKVVALLYDSIITECPIEERHIVAELHQRYMSDETWELHHGKRCSLLIDVEFNLGWSLRPSKADQAKYADTTWNVCAKEHSDTLLAPIYSLAR